MDMRQKIEDSGRDNRWELDRQQLFARTRYMALRCGDLLSVAEMLLGVRTAATVDLRAGPRIGSSRGSKLWRVATLQYGTTAGLGASVLVGLDLLLAVHVPGLLTPLVAPLLPPLPSAPRPEPTPEKGRPPLASLRNAQHAAVRWVRANVPWRTPAGWVRENELWRTFVGWKRLTALPPANAPLQFFIDNVLLPTLNVTYHGHLHRCPIRCT